LLRYIWGIRLAQPVLALEPRQALRLLPWLDSLAFHLMLRLAPDLQRLVHLPQQVLRAQHQSP